MMQYIIIGLGLFVQVHLFSLGSEQTLLILSAMLSEKKKKPAAPDVAAVKMLMLIIREYIQKPGRNPPHQTHPLRLRRKVLMSLLL